MNHVTGRGGALSLWYLPDLLGVGELPTEFKPMANDSINQAYAMKPQ